MNNELETQRGILRNRPGIIREWRNARREQQQRDPCVQARFWGMLLLLIGGLALVSTLGWVSIDNIWRYLPLGIGVILLMEGLLNYRSPEYRNLSWRGFIPGAALIIGGIVCIFNVSH